MKVGVVGVGTMGMHHVRIYHELSCELAGIADLNPQVKELARKYQTSYYRDYRDLLTKVEAVSIAVPTSRHKDVALDFLQEGVHCLIEKPVTADLKSAREIAAKAKQRRVKVLVGHIERFNPAVQKLKEIIEEKILGDLIMISAKRVGPFVWRTKDVGAIVDSATHDIDVMRFLMGKEPEIVFAKKGSYRHEKDDHAVIVLDFGQTMAAIEVNWFTPHKIRNLVVTGSKGIAYVDYLEQKVEVHSPKYKLLANITKEEPLKLEIKHFLECISNDQEPLISAEEGIKTLQIALQAAGSL